MKYKYRVVISKDRSWINEQEIGLFNTLSEAKKKSTEFLCHNCDTKYACVDIVAEPETGVDIIRYWRLPYEPGYKSWRIDDDHDNLVKVVNYRGVMVNVYNDDYGQCYYIRWRDTDNRIRSEGCGTYNPYYEHTIHNVVDYMLDHIAGGKKFDPYYGTELRYIDENHKHAELTHRMCSVKIYNTDDFASEEAMYEAAKRDIKAFCNSPEYLKSEEERLQAVKAGDKGKMYFNEYMESDA